MAQLEPFEILEPLEKLELLYTSNYSYQGYQGYQGLKHAPQASEASALFWALAKAKVANNGANSLFFVQGANGLKGYQGLEVSHVNANDNASEVSHSLVFGY
jgi:hypothetical protein